MFEVSTNQRHLEFLGGFDHQNTKISGRQQLHVSFADPKLEQPKYSLVQARYYQQVEDWVTVAPIFCLRQALKFELEITLDADVSFADGASEVELVNATIAGKDPLQLTDSSPNRRLAEISLPVDAGSDWERWIYRLKVKKDGVTGTFYLGFSYLATGREFVLKAESAGAGRDTRPAGPRDKGALPELFTRIDGARFLDVFDYGQVVVPLDEVRPEPLIILHPQKLKDPSADLALAFEREDGFLDNSANDCDPGNLALICKGVTHPKPCSAPQTYPQGFVRSWRSKDEKRCGFSWSVVKGDPKWEVVPMLATLLFGRSSNSNTRVRSSDLSDPTIIVEQPFPPI